MYTYIHKINYYPQYRLDHFIRDKLPNNWETYSGQGQKPQKRIIEAPSIQYSHRRFKRNVISMIIEFLYVSKIRDRFVLGPMDNASNGLG